MLGRTAASLFWMSRQVERAENIARLTEVGHRLALTPAHGTGYRDDWQSTLAAAGCLDAFRARYDDITADSVTQFLLFDRTNPASVSACLEAARQNGRSVRTALTREMWEALNSTWIEFSAMKPDDLNQGQLPDLLDWIRQRSSLFRGAVAGTLLRDEGFLFADLGAFLERADNTARILDVKYNILLPANDAIAGERHLYQWETILRSVSAHRSYRHVYKERYQPSHVVDFMILRPEMPRSLRFCHDRVAHSLNRLYERTGGGRESMALAAGSCATLHDNAIDGIFKQGLHAFLTGFLRLNATLADKIALEFHFM